MFLWKLVRLQRLQSIIFNPRSSSWSLLPNSCSRVYGGLPLRSIHIGMLKLHFMDDVRQVEKLDKKLVVLDEADLLERHIRGWGSGGQKVNKTANCVALTHIPTGLTVKVHASRSLTENIKIARARLRMKVDIHVRGDESILKQEEERLIRQKNLKSAKAKSNLELKKKLKLIIESDDDKDNLY